MPLPEFLKIEFESSVSKEHYQAFLEEILETIKDQKNIIGSGADGTVYKMNSNIYSKKLVIKVSHTEGKNIRGEMQRIGSEFLNEINVLKKVGNLNDSSQQYVGNLKLKDGEKVKNLLITTFITGESPSPQNDLLNENSLKSILKLLFELDKLGILHRDLKYENFKIDIDIARIFDYGESIFFNYLNTTDNDNNNNFPNFVFPSNIRNFEDTCLMPYIYEKLKQDSGKAKVLYKNYLSLKKEFHNKRIQYLENQQIKIQEMINFEKVQFEALNNINEDIVKTELLKNNISFNYELAYKNEILLLNPLANITLKVNALIYAKKLENFSSNKLKEDNNNKYYDYKIKEAKYKIQKLSSWIKYLTNQLFKCVEVEYYGKIDSEIKNLLSQLITEEKNLGNFEIPEIKF